MKSPRIWLCAAAVLAAFTAACAGGAEMAMQGTAEDETAIRALPDKWEAAFNGGDMGAIAALAGDNYQAVTPEGMLVTGSSGLEQEETKQMQMRQKMDVHPELDISTSFLQWLDADNATLGGTWTATGMPEGQPNKGSWLAVAHKAGDGQWMLSSTLAADYMAPPPEPEAPAAN